MRTEAQIEASRANGRRSQGPVTPEGKARSSQNAFRHGLLAATIVLKGEEIEYFQQYLDQHVQRFQPFDDVEMNLIEEMVGAAWRGRRSAGMQTIYFDTQFANIEPSGNEDQDLAGSLDRLAASPALALLHRYELHYHRIYHRCIATLMKLQKNRPAAPAEPAELAVPNEPKPAVPNEPKAASPAPSPTPTPASYLPNEPKLAPEAPSPIPTPRALASPTPASDPYSRFNHMYRRPNHPDVE